MKKLLYSSPNEIKIDHSLKELKSESSKKKTVRKHLSLIIPPNSNRLNIGSEKCLSCEYNPFANDNSFTKQNSQFSFGPAIKDSGNKENFLFGLAPDTLPIPISISEYLCQEFLDKYQTIDFLGKGAQGVVWKVKEKSSSNFFAAKILKTTDQEKKSLILNEASNLSMISHPNVCSFKELISDEYLGVYILVIEYTDFLPLDQHLETKKYDETTIKQLSSQILKTVAFIHGLNICHRDLHLNNILISRDSEKVKIIDFGLSKLCGKAENDDLMISPTGPFQYRAPEMSRGCYSFQVDVWNLGICILQMFTGKRISSQENKKSFPSSQSFSKEADQLLQLMLHPNPKKRIAASDCLKHPWLIDFSSGSSADPIDHIVY